MSICGIGANLTFLTAEDLAREDQWCCFGAANGGPSDCSCWEPTYDLEQRDPALAPIETRTVMCGDCAYRPDSPERQTDPYALLAYDTFWCHRGIRRPVVWRHPDGRERPGDPADYQPPIIDGVPYRADGRPAARCGGWASYRDELATPL